MYPLCTPMYPMYADVCIVHPYGMVGPTVKKERGEGRGGV